jgi:hypothetical protein
MWPSDHFGVLVDVEIGNDVESRLPADVAADAR